ncbi:MAG: leucine-rich repeat domain-containing protein, partial [Muribaculaceae bacterium]|nr:leucine-rich repeat domain-containing protein [Muribaculaceae bacterium]
MKGKNVILALTLLFSLLSATQISAGEIMDFDLWGYGYDDDEDDECYKNLSFTIDNPETAKGRVYVAPIYQDDAKYCKVTNEPKIAKIVGNISDFLGEFDVRFFVMPADGYVLDCLTTPEAYGSVDYRAKGICIDDGYPLVSQNFPLDSDTANSTRQRPPVGVIPSPVKSLHGTAVFIPSKKMTVRNKKAGQLAEVVKSGSYGENVNDLVVTGPLNSKDFKYLNKLSQEKGLVRLDLSGASFKILPDSAFYNSDLYELSLPQTLDSIGNSAFAYSYGLKPVKLPEKASKGKLLFFGCQVIPMMEKGYISEDPSFISSYDGSQTVQNSSASNNSSVNKSTPTRRKG